METILSFAVVIAACLLLFFIRRSLTARLREMQAEKERLQREFFEESAKLREENAALRTANTQLSTQLEQQKKSETENEERLKTTFENIASKILEEKSDRFAKNNHEQLRTILEPLGREINGFKKQVEETYLNQTRERASLGKELQQIMELNRRLSDEANNLTKALKGEKNPKMQGDWGEMILDSILTNSGLEKGKHYFPQESSRDDEGRTVRPDVIVRYPDGREIIIDSKVSLTAYSRYVAAEEEHDREAALNDHIASVRRHIDQLSAKRYDAREASLDFVMMFLPVEPAYMAALSGDGQLWEYAYKRKILLVSPTHLITALKLIYDLWVREAQNRNALDIADRGAKMYDKFVGFVDDMQEIERFIGKSAEAYDKAFSKLKSGKGNLIRQAEQLKALGIQSAKRLAAESDAEEGPRQPEYPDEQKTEA